MSRVPPRTDLRMSRDPFRMSIDVVIIMIMIIVMMIMIITKYHRLLLLLLPLLYTTEQGPLPHEPSLRLSL